MNDRYRIVTFASHKPIQDYYCYDEFFKSLRGEQPFVLANKRGEYGGLGSKPRLLYNKIKSGEIGQKYIIVCDCFDLVFSFPPIDAFTYYMGEYNGDSVVFSSEKNCFPTDLNNEYDDFSEKFNIYKTSYKYLNSGFIIGKTEAILTLLESFDAKNIPNDYWDNEKKCMINPNDQFYYQQAFLTQVIPMELDYRQALCNTLHSVNIDELDFSEKYIYNNETKDYPCSFHFNGDAKTKGLREPILKHLNLI
jgi:hypothetical protein